MPICELCGKSFGNRCEIRGKIHNLSKRKYCLDCSPFGKHNTIKLNDNPNQKTHKICSACNEDKKNNEFYITSKRIQSLCKNCHNAYLIDKWKKRKIMMVEKFGGKCEACGYCKNFASLIFHHRDPKIKEVSWTKLRLRSIDKIKKELKKCQLLCRNCHGEFHHPELSLNPNI
jgi:hypothetical protein